MFTCRGLKYANRGAALRRSVSPIVPRVSFNIASPQGLEEPICSISLQDIKQCLSCGFPVSVWNVLRLVSTYDKHISVCLQLGHVLIQQILFHAHFEDC